MNCKPGILAMVIRGLTSPSPNVGRIVEVISRIDDHELFGPRWLCASDTPMEVRTPRGEGLATQFSIPDAWLRPVSGLPVNDEQLDEVTA